MSRRAAIKPTEKWRNEPPIRLVADAIQNGKRILPDATGSIFSQSPEDENDVFVRVSGELFDAIPDIHLDLNNLPDPEDLFWDQEIESSECCYFAIAANIGAIKIGFTSDLGRRQSALRTSCPDDLIFYYVPGDMRLERLFHEFFKPIRTRREWYLPHPSLITYILMAG